MEYKLTSKKYIEGLKAGKFLGLKCNSCKAYTVPPRKVCGECGSEDMDIVELSRNGVVKSFTVIHVPAEGFTPPYMVGLIELQEGPWVTVNIINFDPLKADLDFIGRKGRIDYKDVPADMFSGGERIALTFTPGDK
jgi:uncharacterized OB-fold protein